MANHLQHSKSPYLQQHKNNPVDWYPWGDEAFRAARAGNKLIFLSIGYSTCYWCHMMEKDSFEKQEVADVLNKDFISIKVDREEHPEVDQIYMDAVVTLTGQGGWPLSVFLAPDLKPITGATFFWKDQFLSVLHHIRGFWEKEPQKLLTQAKELTQFLSQKGGTAAIAAVKKISDTIFEKALQELQSHFDAAHGGFGGAPKFPQASVLQLLMRIWRRTQDENALNMAVKTLEAMAAGEIFDKIGGGFHRYATREDWNEPHYEKMLYDNALLAAAYLQAFEITKNKKFADVARRTFDYVLRDMTDPQGGFYSAEDAGEVGKEGEYYKGTTAEQRQKMKRPHRDEKILTSWNGLMIAAMAKGYSLLGEKKYLQAAQEAVHFIQKNLFQNDLLLRRHCHGDNRFPGTLDDYAFFIHGLLALERFEEAAAIQKIQDAIFWDEKEGAYFRADPKSPELVVHQKEFHDGAIPSGNAFATLNLVQLYTRTGKNLYRDKAEKLLKRIIGQADQYPSGFAASLIALDEFLHPQASACKLHFSEPP